MALTPMVYEEVATSTSLPSPTTPQSNYTVSNDLYILKGDILLVSAVVQVITTQSSYMAVKKLPSAPSGKSWAQQFCYCSDNAGGYVEVGLYNGNLVVLGGTNGRYTRFQLMTMAI